MWYEGELRPVEKDWLNPPQGMLARGDDCEHENGVVAPRTKDDTPGYGAGTIYLHCMHCDSDWQEPLSNVKGSPWEGK